MTDFTRTVEDRRVSPVRDRWSVVQHFLLHTAVAQGGTGVAPPSRQTQPAEGKDDSNLLLAKAASKFKPVLFIPPTYPRPGARLRTEGDESEPLTVS